MPKIKSNSDTVDSFKRVQSHLSYIFRKKSSHFHENLKIDANDQFVSLRR